MITAVMKGAWLGLCIAAPVGPIGVLVLNQSLQTGRWTGIASGFGAALADMTYGFLAVVGVRLAAGYARFIGVTGGIVLLLLAWRLWHEAPSGQSAAVEAGSLGSATITTFLLTLSNPMTILSFAALVAGAGIEAPSLFVVGVFLGSMLWWLILSLSAASLRSQIGIRGAVLNRLAAFSLASFGAWAIWSKTVR
jgi:putative LysE/RhtB family amino acid efflux pump